MQRARVPSVAVRHPHLAVVAMLASWWAPDAGADESLRCGNALVTVGMVAAEVVARCGQPGDRHVTEASQRTRGSGTRSVRVERWTYDRGYGQFPALLTFSGGRLQSIELLTR
ncbi:MAG TPA: DUF2845 domain-containing protein [Gammaproteobacteria bacterium]|nr:DUF2845 domain-containing protein [Gammaproteobacteria bacterium]